MKTVVAALVAALEAACVALVMATLLAVPAVLLWWLRFDLSLAPNDLVALIAGIWQLVYFIPLELSVDAQSVLGVQLGSATVAFTLSLPPLALTVVTAVFASRSGLRFARHGVSAFGVLLGGSAGFAAAAALAATAAAPFASWPLWASISVPALVYAAPLAAGIVARRTRDGLGGWLAVVHGTCGLLARILRTNAAIVTAHTLTVLRIVAGSLLMLIAVGCLGVLVALLTEYVDIVTISESLHLDVGGVVLVFLLQLVALPAAWVWALAWLAGPGFSLGSITSSPFELSLGPIPALPLFGAIPADWGWAGWCAPLIMVLLGVGGGLTASTRLGLRRAAMAPVTVIVLCAALLTGLLIALLCWAASGAIGPEHFAMVGPHAWQVGGAVMLELACGMLLGCAVHRPGTQLLIARVLRRARAH